MGRRQHGAVHEIVLAAFHRDQAQRAVARVAIRVPRPRLGRQGFDLLAQALRIEAHGELLERAREPHSQAASTDARKWPMAGTSAASDSRSTSVRCGFHTSKISTIRGDALRFQASCS